MSTYLMAAGGAELPVGYIFEFDATGLSNAPDLSTAAKVREYFGYGTWEAYGAGRVMVGVGTGYAVGSEGGEATHTLTTAEMPTHYHEYTERVNWVEDTNKRKNSIVVTWSPENKYALCIDATPTQGSKMSGNGQPHNNLQPYRVVYRWRRIA